MNYTSRSRATSELAKLDALGKIHTRIAEHCKLSVRLATPRQKWLGAYAALLEIEVIAFGELDLSDEALIALLPSRPHPSERDLEALQAIRGSFLR